MKLMIRSPGGPLREPCPPCPRKRIFIPVSVPSGTVTAILRRARTSPDPPQLWHRSLGICPRPRHWGHGRCTANPPCPNEIVPRPPHSGHVCILEPGAPPLPLQTGH